MAEKTMKNVPQIRFKGFSWEWEERSLENCTLRIGDGLHGTPKYVDKGDVFFINGNNLVSGRIILTEETKKVTKNEQSKDDVNLNTNTILMSINGTIGNLAQYQKERIMLGKSVAYITLDNLGKYYAYTYLQTPHIQNYFNNNLTGSTIKNLGLKTIRETNVRFPSTSEQSKIGAYFQELDRLIGQHQSKHEKMVTLKKAMLKKMFPQKGSTVPEIRFKGFSDEWEEKSLHETVDLIGTGKSNFITSPERSRDKPYAVLGSRSIIGYDNHYDYDGEFILTARVGENAGKLYQHSGKVKISDNTVYIKCPTLNYIFHSLSAFDLSKLAFGTGQPLIKASELSKLKIKIPQSPDEQIKIGAYFRQLDKLIAQHDTQLEKLKKIKLACLEKMFV